MANKKSPLPRIEPITDLDTLRKMYHEARNSNAEEQEVFEDARKAIEEGEKALETLDEAIDDSKKVAEILKSKRSDLI